MIKNYSIICMSPSEWNKPWGSKQSLMVELSKNNRVLYVEYQSSFLDFFIHPVYFLSRICKWNRTRNVGENIYAYTPVPLLPFGAYFIFINFLNQKIMLFFLKKVFRNLKLDNRILWFYIPFSSPLIGKINEKMVVYHCIADFINEKKNTKRRANITYFESLLVNKSDIILTLTKGLYERFKPINKNTYFFPSAVDFESFEKIRNAVQEEPSDVAHIPHPRIGMVAYLDGNIIDTEILVQAVKKYTNVSFVLIGPLFRNVNAFTGLKKYSNVYFLGEKNIKDVPSYLKALDVFLIPYRKNAFLNNVSPLKLYEYFSFGKPIVSTAFSDDIQAYDDLVYIINTGQEFIDAIYQSLHENNCDKISKRISIAYNNSWQMRLKFFENKVNGVKKI